MSKRKAEKFPYRERHVLLVDLVKESFQVVTLSEDDGKRLFGGRALSLTLWDRYADWTKLKKEDYEAGNPVVFASGAGSDMDVSYLDGYVVTTLSPVTRRVETYAGNGSFSKVFGSLSCSAIIITGRRSRITRVAFDMEHVTFNTEEELHNLRTSAIVSRYPEMHTVSIGPAGEQQVPSSTIAVDGRLLGRAGIAEVFARKNVKVMTFAIHENSRPSYDAEALGKLKDHYEKIEAYQKKPLLSYGKKYGWAACHAFQDGSDGRLWALEGQSDFLSYLALGPQLDQFDPKKIVSLLDGCQELGIDPLSISVVLQYALEQGLADSKELYRAIESVAYRKGRLVSLSDGAPKEYFTIGGLEMPPLNIRRLPSMALLLSQGSDTVVYADLIKGNRLRRGEETMFARRAIEAEDLRFVMESLGIDYRFASPLGALPVHLRLLPYWLLSGIASASEGWKVSPHDLVHLAKSVYAEQKWLDDKVGWKAPLGVPQFFTTVPWDGEVVVLPRLLDAYVSLRERDLRTYPSFNRTTSI